MANQETFVANAAESTLSSSLAIAATTVNVTSTAAFPAVPFYATIDPGVDASREVVLATAKTATTLTVTRAQDGTADVAHASGAVIAQVPVAALWTDINDRVDELPTLAENNAAYEPLGGTTTFVPAGALGAVEGSPTLGIAGTVRWSVMLYDAATREGTASSFIVIPSGWATVNIDLYWTNAGAGSGDVVWSGVLDVATDGGSLSTSGTGAAATITAPAQNVMKVSRLFTGTAVTAGDLASIRVVRVAADAADTLGNDAGVVGLRITKAS